MRNVEKIYKENRKEKKKWSREPVFFLDNVTSKGCVFIEKVL